MSDTNELPAALYEQIQALCAEGDDLADAQRFDDAIARYRAAWDLLPAPKQTWGAATWILAAIGDAAFQADRPTDAFEALGSAMLCPGAIGNPFLHLRLGQVLLDLGDETAAADELTRAHMGGGPEIFAAEDPRYLAFLATHIKL
jgi:tetratricopeptide (TPR) repeat protein